MERRRRSELILIMAMILASHIGLLWLLIAHSRRALPATLSAALELIYIAPTSQSERWPRLPAVPAVTGRRHGGVRTATTAASPSPPADASTASTSAEPDHSIPLPVDWSGEAGRAARDAIARQAAPQPRDFGFPKSPAAGLKAPQFGWDRAATHRVESLPGGGIYVNLNDNCVLVLFPLPFAGCAIGKRPANGTLFEHMQDAKPSPGSESSP